MVKSRICIALAMAHYMGKINDTYTLALYRVLAVCYCQVVGQAYLKLTEYNTTTCGWILVHNQGVRTRQFTCLKYSYLR